MQQPGTGQASDGGVPRNSRRRIITIVVAIVTVGVVSWVAATNWQEWMSLLQEARWRLLIGALGAALVGQFLNAAIAHRSLRSRGSDISLASVYRINAVGGLAKFIPGGVWQIGSQYGLGRAAGLDFRKSMLAWVEPTAFNVTVGAGIALLAATTVDYGIPVWLLIPGAIVALVASTNPVRNWLYKLIRLVPAEEATVDSRGWPANFAIAVSIIGLTGLGGMLVVNAFSLEPTPGFVGSLAAFVGAWVVGVLVFPIPGGLGVREGALVVGLAPWLSAPQAVLIATASRLVAVAAELIAAMVSLAFGDEATQPAIATTPNTTPGKDPVR